MITPPQSTSSAAIGTLLNRVESVPPGWDRRPLKLLLRSMVAGGTPDSSNPENWTDESDGIPWVTIGDMTASSVIRDTRKHITPRAAREKRLQILPPGTLLYSIYASLGKVAVLAVPAVTNQAILGLIPNQAVVHQPYLRWWLMDFERDVGSLSSSNTQENLNAQKVRNIPVLLPPIDVQRAIADYLDEKTAAIDALIAKRERHIELLEEKRLTVLVDRVTRGLGPTVPMRESGVGWLGAVPAHWKIAPTRFVARLETGHTPSRQHPEYWVPEECTVPWFTLADVWQIRDGRPEYLGDTAEKVSPLGLANSAARLLPAETVVLSRTASVGFSGIMPVPMATSQDFVNWVCGPEVRPLYLLYVFRAMRQEFRRLTMGSTHQTIYMPDVRDFRTPLPPLAEQDAIVAVARSEMARHDGLVVRLREQIAKLREYRQTLISAAVTGKIDVREPA